VSSILFGVYYLRHHPSGILGQCIECKARGQFHCQTNYTGYYCAPGAYINENEISKDKCQTKSRTYDSPFSPCTPYPFEISSVFGASTERTEELLIILSRSLHRDVLLSLFTLPWLPVGSESRYLQYGEATCQQMRGLHGALPMLEQGCTFFSVLDSGFSFGHFHHANPVYILKNCGLKEVPNLLKY